MNTWDEFQKAGMGKIVNEALKPHGWMLVYTIDEECRVASAMPTQIVVPKVTAIETLSADDQLHVTRLETLSLRCAYCGALMGTTTCLNCGEE